MNRRPELDWLRVVAIAILHVFHVGMIFNRWDFHLKNPDPLPVIEEPMAFLHQIRMPMLMVIAGIATAIALERRSIGALAVDRIKRLLVPLVFGMLVIVPPQIYVERITSGGYTGSYLTFYPSVFELRPYPAGSFSWHHLWFVAYLFVYCMLALPVFAGLATASGRRLLGWLDRAWARGWGIVVFVPLAIERIALRDYPETHDLTHDPNTLAYYGLLFAAGHLLGRSATVWDHLVARRGRYLAATCVLLAVMLPPNECRVPFEQLGALATIWCLILTALGWTRWYFQRPAARVPSWLDHAQKLSYPFYILHQTVILVIGWAWLQVALGSWPRFGAVLVSSFVATWCCARPSRGWRCCGRCSGWHRRGAARRGSLGAFTVFGLWQGNTVWLAMQADHDDSPWSHPYFWEMTGTLSAFVWSWIPCATAKNAPRPAGRWPRFVAIHAAGYAAYAALHTSVMLGVRVALYPVLGWGAYHYGGTSFRLPMEWHKDLLAYVLLAVGYGLISSWRDAQRRELRVARLATELRDAQLRALVGQLNPHFLFNVLNTISAVMYTDLPRTDRLLADLGQMLRAGLTGDAAPTWSLAEERTHTEHFLEVMLARFGDRLSVRWCVDDAVRAAQVPRFTLQLLVEKVRFDGLFHGDALVELEDGSSVVVSRTHRDGFFSRWRGR